MPYSQPRASSGAGWLSGSMKAAPAIRTIVASEVAAMILPTASMILGCVRLAYSPQRAIRAMAVGPRNHSSVVPSSPRSSGAAASAASGAATTRAIRSRADAEIAPAGAFEKALGVEAGTHL